MVIITPSKAMKAVIIINNKKHSKASISTNTQTTDIVYLFSFFPLFFGEREGVTVNGLVFIVIVRPFPPSNFIFCFSFKFRFFFLKGIIIATIVVVVVRY